MALLIHRAERADALVDALGALLRAPRPDPFQPEIVAVPTKGVERWLAQQLGAVLGAVDGDGICANVLFPSYREVLDDALGAADADYAEAVEAWSPERSVWPLLEVIDRCEPHEAWCRTLTVHLAAGGAGEGDRRGRRFAVAEKLARFYDRYGRSRPELVVRWQAGRDEAPGDLIWQAELWRRLRERIGSPSPAELLDHACSRVGGGAGFSVFGPTRISPARVRMLQALAREREIHLWLPHPSPALWDAVHAAGERAGPRRGRPPIVRNQLLASMSRDLRELQHLIAGVEHDDVLHVAPGRPPSVLGRLQEVLATDATPTQRVPVDDSIQVHAAHGPARQVEVLREAILGLLAADPSLEPRDVVVMCPDVEAYAPLVAASFGLADDADGHPAARLRVRLADRALRQTNPLLQLLARVLEVAAGRVTATEMLDVLSARPVRRRFRFDDDDVERMREWAVSTGARWGLDGTHRSEYHLDGIGQGTWRAALDRLLLGVALEDDGTPFGDVLPLDDVDSADIDLAGRFAEAVDRIATAVERLGRPRTVRDWAATLLEVTTSLGESDEPWAALELRRELDAVAESAADTNVELGLADVTALLRHRLAGRPTRANFRTGTLTVCTLMPMRAVPHRVVCLLGLDDGAFPRQAVADGDDLLARDPRSGERDPRSEDRQLFLDAICAAREHLVVTYTGADPRTGAEVPPCVPLGELLDAVDAIATGTDGVPARRTVVRRHPLQPFDPRNFAAPDPFSFDRLALAGARAAVRERHRPRALVERPLPAPPVADVAVEDLVAFLQHPARGFLRQRLGISTYEQDGDPEDALPLSVGALDRWRIGDRVLAQCLRGTPRETAARAEYLRGELPPGRLGAAELRDIGATVDALLRATELERSVAARAVDIGVRLAGGRRLVGTVGGLRGDTILDVSFSKPGPRQRLGAWVRLLAIVAETGDAGLRAAVVGKARDGAERWLLVAPTSAQARELLDDLVALRESGLRAPLPMAPKTSAEYAAARQRMGEANARSRAARVWESGAAAENAEREHRLLFGADLAFDRFAAGAPEPGEAFTDETTRFGVLARRLWTPVLAQQIAVRP